ncbi:sulfurtransferase [Streptomyces sp. NPDC047002]|uniref:sulfurtransferase n=1 Tax=Streptomyces sp. NPDC047002 TaxID=3155475 RepID=UPI003454FAB9
MSAPGAAGRSAVLAGAAELLALTARPGGRPVLLHVGNPRPGGGDPLTAYRAAHLPGAVYADLPRDLAGEPGHGTGRRPLPEPARLQDALRRWGVRASSAVVVYDDEGGRSAGRAWWVLRWAGLFDVRLLDGGLAAWSAAGGPLTADVPEPAPGDVRVAPGALPVLDAAGAARLAAEGLLLDARSAPQYRGEAGQGGDRPAGHIPGAVSAPTGENLGPDGRFAGTAELVARFRRLGADGSVPVGVYCGGGVAAAHEIAALAAAGIEAALYPGSWSAWIGDPGRPVATGPRPWGGDG